MKIFTAENAEIAERIWRRERKIGDEDLGRRASFRASGREFQDAMRLGPVCAVVFAVGMSSLSTSLIADERMGCRIRLAEVIAGVSGQVDVAV